jgi:hypothetical protein
MHISDVECTALAFTIIRKVLSFSGYKISGFHGIDDFGFFPLILDTVRSCMWLSSTLKMMVEVSSESSITTCSVTLYHNPQSSNLI